MTEDFLQTRDYLLIKKFILPFFTEIQHFYLGRFLERGKNSIRFPDLEFYKIPKIDLSDHLNPFLPDKTEDYCYIFQTLIKNVFQDQCKLLGKA